MTEQNDDGVTMEQLDMGSFLQQAIGQKTRRLEEKPLKHAMIDMSMAVDSRWLRICLILGAKY